MKIKFDNFEVDIKVKDPVSGKYTGKESEVNTLYLLNRISVLYMEASRWEECQGLKNVSNLYNKASNEIYKVLEEKGFYED